MPGKDQARNEVLATSYRIGNRTDSIYDHCLMMIGCGKWPAGMRLPSVRAAEKVWGVNRMAVQQAYKRLASQGIVISKSRSGYFVSNQNDVQKISDHRVELENLFRTISGTITETTGLASLPVFRYLAKLAQIRDTEAPQCAFVECTMIQAETHAAEIANRFGVAVLPMTVEGIAGNRNRVPQHVGILLTTHFHIAELRPLGEADDLEVAAVPIEVSPQLVEMTQHCSKFLLLLKEEQQTASTVAEDAGNILGCPPIDIEITNDLRGTLSEMFGSDHSGPDSDTFVLVSPREWSRMGEEWRDHPNVELVPFRIREEAWDLIADVVGMPLGALG